MSLEVVPDYYRHDSQHTISSNSDDAAQFVLAGHTLNLPTFEERSITSGGDNYSVNDWGALSIHPSQYQDPISQESSMQPHFPPDPLMDCLSDFNIAHSNLLISDEFAGNCDTFPAPGELAAAVGGPSYTDSIHPYYTIYTHVIRTDEDSDEIMSSDGDSEDEAKTPSSQHIKDEFENSSSEDIHLIEHMQHDFFQMPAECIPFRCLWESCSHDFTPDLKTGKVTVPMVRAHFRETHPNTMDHGQHQCRWAGCYDLLESKSIPKHVGNRHLKAGESECVYCRKTVSTKDALKRHQESNCAALKKC